MKKNLLIASLLLSGAATAQFTQSNEPAIGAGQAMYELEETADPYASSTGTGQTWDYSGYFGLTSTTRAFSVVDPSATPEGSNFPSATKAIEIESFMTTYLSSTASSRNSQGFSFEDATMGTVNVILSTDDELLMNYPMAQSNSLVDVFAGTVEMTAGTYPCAGNNAAIVDGQGTLILNSSTTISNVLRYMIVDTADADLGFPIGAAQLIRKQYEYYALGTNSELPLFIHSSLSISLGGGAPTETVFVLSSAAPDGYLNVNENELTGVAVYPNPATETINLKGLKANASLTLVDAQGKTVAAATVEPGVASMNVANVNAGVYFLHIASNNETTVERVVIK